jgi:hypothetical protein
MVKYYLESRSDELFARNSEWGENKGTSTLIAAVQLGSESTNIAQLFKQGTHRNNQESDKQNADLKIPAIGHGA